MKEVLYNNQNNNILNKVESNVFTSIGFLNYDIGAKILGDFNESINTLIILIKNCFKLKHLLLNISNLSQLHKNLFKKSTKNAK